MKNSSHAVLARAIAAGAGVLLLCGCALGPLSGDTVWGGTPRPADAPLPDDPPGSFDGVYAGAATDATGSVTCASPLSITNFQVNDARVEFGGFRGPINADGTVNIGYSGAWLVGVFRGTGLSGHIDTDGSRSQVGGCLYAVSLQRLGT